MKTYLCLLLLSFTFIQCKKDNTKKHLPPETTSGAGTFGCLVNGEVLLPGGANLSGGSLQANYQHLGPSLGNGYYLNIIGRYYDKKGNGKSVGVFADSVKIESGITYPLKERIDGQCSGDYFYFTPQSPARSFTTDGILNTGVLTITRFDSTNQIVSGKFWFDVIDDTGNKIEIREGRFDVHYTR